MYSHYIDENDSKNGKRPKTKRNKKRHNDFLIGSVEFVLDSSFADKNTSLAFDSERYFYSKAKISTSPSFWEII